VVVVVVAVVVVVVAGSRRSGRYEMSIALSGVISS
jgi:hypothetical protein